MYLKQHTQASYSPAVPPAATPTPEPGGGLTCPTAPAGHSLGSSVSEPRSSCKAKGRSGGRLSPARDGLRPLNTPTAPAGKGRALHPTLSPTHLGPGARPSTGPGGPGALPAHGGGRRNRPGPARPVLPARPRCPRSPRSPLHGRPTRPLASTADRRFKPAAQARRDPAPPSHWPPRSANLPRFRREATPPVSPRSRLGQRLREEETDLQNTKSRFSKARGCIGRVRTALFSAPWSSAWLGLLPLQAAGKVTGRRSPPPVINAGTIGHFFQTAQFNALKSCLVPLTLVHRGT